MILFGLPEKKDEVATGAWAENGIVQQAARAIKREVPDLMLMGDVCLCEYMSHGHCGIVKATPGTQSLGAAVAAPPAATTDYEIVNDASLELLARTSVSLAKAGIDIIAPSDMMDGRVAAIRKALDEAGLINTPILSYAAKFASGFYGPFREAADSAPQFGDRRSYQMDGANVREAMREIEADIEEGADMIMVKPAMPYLDVIAAARDRFDLPLAAYQVSGEYAMIEAAARNGWIERDRVMMESLLSHPASWSEHHFDLLREGRGEIARLAAKLLSAENSLNAARVTCKLLRSGGALSRKAHFHLSAVFVGDFEHLARLEVHEAGDEDVGDLADAGIVSGDVVIEEFAAVGDALF